MTVNPFAIPTNQLLGAAIAAIIAALLKHKHDLYLAERKDRLERTNQQLQLLYGPLYALSHASNAAWAGFRTRYGTDRRSYWGPGVVVPVEEAEAWRLWMQEVFMPLVERMETIVIEHAHLLEEREMPSCLLELCAHVETYRGTLKEWDKGCYTYHTSVINYPSGLAEYASQRFALLKLRQAHLLQQVASGRATGSSTSGG